jgi:orotate phosphoribosyltransferase
VSPALGGIIIGHEVARAMNTRFVFTERAGRRMALRRGFRIGAGEKALVVEDVVTTGGSIREVIEIIEECGAEAVGVAAIVSRGVRVDFGVPFLYLVEAEIENHTPQDCALCKEGVPLVKPGSKRVPAEDQ